MSNWECVVCNYIHKQEQAPESCPVCKAAQDKFAPRAEVDAESAWNEALKQQSLAASVKTGQEESAAPAKSEVAEEAGRRDGTNHREHRSNRFCGSEQTLALHSLWLHPRG